MTIARSRRRWASAVPLALVATGLVWQAGRTFAGPSTSPEALAKRAVSADGSAARDAIAALRDKGPAGLDALRSVYASEIRQHDPNDARWQKIAAALDAVAQQKDSADAGLFWYTDLDRARQAARASGKPILSLRLLGKLNEDLSCANSRFFRTTLYPNAEIAAFLRANYILHWQSERPVPVLTLDFGDGRKMVRTITGNSIHYVLDSKGRPVDALPGLYGPKAFLRHLTEDAEVARRSGAIATDPEQRQMVQAWHTAQFEALSAAWTTDSKAAFGNVARLPNLTTLILPIGNPRPKPGDPPSATAAGRLAGTKAVVEMPIVTALAPPSSQWALGATELDGAWDRLGQLHADDAALDTSSRRLIAAKQPDLTRVPMMTENVAELQIYGVPRIAPAVAVAPPDQAMNRLLANFQRSIAQDSARNEYVFHAKLHQWFAAGSVTSLEALNGRVYSDLFLTPSSDPWLGLAPGGAFTGLQNDGIVPAASSGTTNKQLAGR